MLRRRGVEVKTGQSVAEASDGFVHLTTGDKVPTRSLIWCVGVRPDPLVEGLDLSTGRGRLVVDALMAVPGTLDIYACGDCAAVPDLTRPGEICGMTAQHAERQGKWWRGMGNRTLKGWAWLRLKGLSHGPGGLTGAGPSAVGP